MLDRDEPLQGEPDDRVLAHLGLRPAAAGVTRMPGREWEYLIWPEDESLGRLIGRP